MKKIFEKNVEETEMIGVKEETEMSFFEKHKTGLFVGGISLFAAVVAGVVVAICGNDSDSDEETYDENSDTDEVEETVD